MVLPFDQKEFTIEQKWNHNSSCLVDVLDKGFKYEIKEAVNKVFVIDSLCVVVPIEDLAQEFGNQISDVGILIL